MGAALNDALAGLFRVRNLGDAVGDPGPELQVE